MSETYLGFWWTLYKVTMGNRASSRSKEDRDAMKIMSSRYIDNEIQAIEQFERTRDTDRAIVSVNSTNKFLQIMKKQLHRKDKVLVKADIIAILVNLKPELMNSIETLDTYTVLQLNAMIRSIVYDINRISTIVSMPGLTMSPPSPVALLN